MAALRFVGGAGGPRRAEFIAIGLRALSSKANGESKTGTCGSKLDMITCMEMEEDLRTEHRILIPQLSDLMKASNRSTSVVTKEFDVKTGSAFTGAVQHSMKVIDTDTKFYKSSCEEDLLKEAYFSLVRPALVARCLIFPFKIDDPQAAGLNEAYKRITGLHAPYYISSRDLMITLKCMDKDECVYFLDFLNAKRVLVIEDWINSYGTLFGVGRYDHGLNCTPDGTEYYRGQCDASVNMKEGTCRIASIIWKGKQVIACQVLVDIPIEIKKGDENGKQSSAKAEAVAMFYLLKLAISMGIKNLQVSTDNRTVDEVLRGMHEITDESNCRDICRVLQYLRRHFSILVSRWEPRDFPDGLIRSYDSDTIPRNKNSPYMRDLLKKWSYYLNGYPIFYLKQKKKKSPLLKNLDDKKAQLASIEDVCYLEVEEAENLTHCGICVRLCIQNRFLSMFRNKDTGSRELVEKLKEKFGEGCDFLVTAQDGYSVISYLLTHSPGMESKKSLTIIFDSAVPQKDQYEDNGLTVILLTPDERREDTRSLKIPEYSPISFASFHTKRITLVPTKTRNPGVSGIF